MSAPARAGFPLPEPPLPQRVALADAIIVGKVTEVVSDPVLASAIPKITRAPAVSYRLAVVQVETSVRGAKDLREIRVGFAAPPRRRTDFGWTVGQGGCFFVRKHPDGSFFVIESSFDVLDRARSRTFDRDFALVQRCAKLLDDPEAGLRSKDAEDRLLTAGMLIFRYRTPRHVYRGEPKTEPIDAGLSRLILSVLAEGPWTEKDVRAPAGRLRLFLRIGLTDKDGWQPTESPKDTASAAQQWLHANAERYRIRRYVAENGPGDK
jgi:hypothetical protein